MRLYTQTSSGITVGTTTITGGTSGAIPFNGAGVYQEDATVLFWDNTNNYLLVGLASGSARVHIKGSGTTTNYAMKVQDSSSGDLLSVREDGLIIVGKSTTPLSFGALTIGKNSGFDNTLANIFIGTEIAIGLTTGSHNTGVGFAALYGLQGVSYNSAFGEGALEYVNSNNNSAFGYHAAKNTTTNGGVSAFGVNALITNTTGPDNCAFGVNALYSNTTGSSNSAFGVNALYANTTGGFYNSAFGIEALTGNTSGTRNTGMGSRAGYGTTTGSYNASLGFEALFSSTTADGNTAIGAGALKSNASLGGNTAVGLDAGYSSTGYRCLFLGRESGKYSTENDAFYIHNGLGVTNEATGKTNSLMYGLFNATATSQLLTINSQVYINGRLNEKQGTDTASASTLTLSGDGNSFELTGTTAVNLITSTGWQEGSIIHLIANENVTINNGTATSGSNITIKLAGAANFAMTADDVLTLILSSTTAGGQAWREVSRSVN